MELLLPILVLILCVAIFIWIGTLPFTLHQKMCESRDKENMAELASAIYQEICSYCKKNCCSLLAIVGIETEMGWTIVRYVTQEAQVIKYRDLGYEVGPDRHAYIAGQKRYWLQKALVGYLGNERWAVFSSKEDSSFTDEKETVYYEEDGRTVPRHPTYYFSEIESKIVTREAYEKMLEAEAKAKSIKRI